MKRMLSNEEDITANGRTSSSSQQREHTASMGVDDEDDLVYQIYDTLLRESAVLVAAGMHRIFQTSGSAATMNSRSRRELYPTLYSDDDDDSLVQKKLDQYVTTVPESHIEREAEEMEGAVADATMDGVNVEEAAGSTAAPPPASEPPTPVLPTTTQQQDIWGKTPLKEDPNRFAVCRICGRHVSTLRFAPHLDKCMGLNNTTRTAAANAASTIQAAIRSSNHGS
jgi:hypothetical protein